MNQGSGRHKGAPPALNGARGPRVGSRANDGPDLNAIKGTGSRARPRVAGRRRPHGIVALSALCSATRRSGSRNRGAGLPGALYCALYLSVRPGILLSGPGRTAGEEAPFRRGATVFENSTACALSTDPRSRSVSRFDPSPARLIRESLRRRCQKLNPVLRSEAPHVYVGLLV